MANVFDDNTLKATVLPQNSNLVNCSILKEYYSPSPFRSFSIKYVVDGSELYSVNGKKYIIRNRQYLLANKFSEGFVVVDSKKSVKGICIDLAPGILSEAVASHIQPDTSVSDIQLDIFFNTPSFFENKYNAEGTHLGKYLTGLETSLQQNPGFELSFTKEFYFRLSEAIIADHVPVYKQLQKVRALRSETKKDLLRKLLIAREYMDAYFLLRLNTEAIALQAGISEYHFYRLFRQVFHQTPHQYLIRKRLYYAREMLQQGETSVSTVAAASGFNDIFSFSKSFKKYFGYSPANISRLKNHFGM